MTMSGEGIVAGHSEGVVGGHSEGIVAGQSEGMVGGDDEWRFDAVDEHANQWSSSSGMLRTTPQGDSSVAVARELKLLACVTIMNIFDILRVETKSGFENLSIASKSK